MAITNRYIVLYWIKAHVPSKEQLLDSRQYGANVMFRNANFHEAGEGMEPCTAVAGEVPEDYAKQFPKAVPYTEWLDGKLPYVAPPKPAQQSPMPEIETSIKLARGPLSSRFIVPEAPPVESKPLPGLADDAGGGWQLPPPPVGILPPTPAPGDATPPPPPPPPPAS